MLFIIPIGDMCYYFCENRCNNISIKIENTSKYDTVHTEVFWNKKKCLSENLLKPKYSSNYSFNTFPGNIN